MHGKLYPHDLEACAKLTRGQMLVYMALVLHSDQNRRCWPSQSTIAKRTGLSRQTVIRSLRALEADGLITSTHRGGRSVKLYQLRPDGAVPTKSSMADHDVTFGTVDVPSGVYIKANPDVTFGTVDVTFSTVDVPSEVYTNKEQKEHSNYNNTSSSLALGKWNRLADQIRKADIKRTGRGHVGDYRSALIRQMHPLGEGQFAVPSALDDFAEEIRPSIRAVIGRDPSFVLFDGVWK